MVEPQETLGNVEEEFPCTYSGGGAANTSVAQQQYRRVPVSDEQDNGAKGCDERARRHRVYDSLLRKWKQAAPSAEPRPRSSHPRVLGGQALITRQRGESFSGEDASTLFPSWGSLSDTMSPAAQIAWREQLLRRKVSRLAGVPTTVLLRQGVHGVATAATVAATRASATVATADGTASATTAASATLASATTTAAAVVAAGGYQVVSAAASSSFCTKLTARAVIEGRCPVAILTTSSSSSSSSSSSPAAASGPVEVLLGRGEPRVYEAYREVAHAVGATRGRDRGEGDKKFEAEVEVGAGPGEGARVGVGVEATAGRLGGVSMTVDAKTSVARADALRGKSSLLTAKTPVRGFHLVDLHGVVRNYVEWRHCIPKVEACFRVGDNRDEVLLGVAHTLGVRLSCSSVHDVHAAVAAARRVSASSAPSPRLLDTHVCRPPGLLRASSAAEVQVYEVDSADELRRVWASLCKVNSRRTAASRESKNTIPSRLEPNGGSPADVLIRLAMPFRPVRQAPDFSATGAGEAATAPAFSRPLEATYGASAEDVVEIVRAAAATSAMLNGPIPIVGFSIDVGPACLDDSLSAAAGVELAAVAAAATLPLPDTGLTTARTPLGTGLAKGLTPPGTGTGARSPLSGSAVAPGEAVASAALSKDIDTAVATAVEMARCAATAAAAAVTDTAYASSLAKATIVEGAHGESKGEGGVGISKTTPSPRAPFVFQRLHVTGLGEGGARGEPLTALKEAVYRHLPKTGSDDGRAVGTASAGGAGGKPFAVSADATAYLVAGGVWSTVASIIGRKGVAPVAGSSTARAAVAGGGSGSGSVSCRGSEKFGDDGGAVDANPGGGGAMYYIDDGCYGSLSGALLRGVRMQPLPLSPAFADEPSAGQDEQGTASATDLVNAGSSGSTDATDAVSRESLPCTVWGPTCDGLDCVSRVTPLPDNMEPGRDWLYFPDTGTRTGADATDFNGLKPLDLFYCLRQ